MYMYDPLIDGDERRKAAAANCCCLSTDGGSYGLTFRRYFLPYSTNTSQSRDYIIALIGRNTRCRFSFSHWHMRGFVFQAPIRQLTVNLKKTLSDPLVSCLQRLYLPSNILSNSYMPFECRTKEKNLGSKRQPHRLFL